MRRYVEARNVEINIGAGFNYDFDTLGQGETNELCVAFMELFAPVSVSTVSVPSISR